MAMASTGLWALGLGPLTGRRKRNRRLCVCVCVCVSVHVIDAIAVQK